MSDAGVPLPGGNSNAPVRYGDRVHRESGPWTPAVHAYLRHLRAAGVDLVPEPFGFDDRGREVLAFLPGEVPAYPLPDAVWTEAFLAETARVLRALHDASTSFDRAGRIWQQPSREPDEVIAVNDFAPYNLVVRDGAIVGVIDLDQASPGPRVRDLAHLAYRLVPLTRLGHEDAPDRPIAERGRRLRLLADAYGGIAPLSVLDAAGPLLEDVAAHAERAGRPDHAVLYRDDRAWLSTTAEQLLADAS